MRRWTAALAAVVLLATPTGCTGKSPAASPAEPPFRPEAGVCLYADSPDALAQSQYTPFTCANPHRQEIYYVGDLTGAATVGDPYKPYGSLARRAGYAECQRQGDEFLGGSWLDAQVRLDVLLPGLVEWQKGARWFVCTISPESDSNELAAAPRGSLKGGMAEPARLHQRCLEPEFLQDELSRFTPRECTAAHHAEFAGVWTPPETLAPLKANDTRTERGCRSVIATYTGVPDDDEFRHRIGWLADPMEADWYLGVRAVRCYLWHRDKAVTRSYRNAGPKVLPVRADF